VVELLLGSRQPSFGGLIARDGYFWPDTPMVIDRPMKRWREYGLPFFAVRLPGIARLLRGVLRDTDNVSDAAVMTGADDYGRPPGVRQRLAPARFRNRDRRGISQVLHDNQVKLIGWRDIQERWG